MKTNLIEGEDFYWEEIDGIKYRVFTEAYHAKRGFCCKNNCRHCAFKTKQPKKEKI